ncbi:hypothetical protein [Aquimarina sp. SS2-1]|uniref:hypothetical protein n=1 Tax=Aquimarina besae TaxID=3342247 RepID=UPI00366A6230
MKTLLNDLHLYELILLFLGVFLFLILSAGLVYYIIKKEEIKKLLLFFPIPVLMIGYPSIKEITISNDKIAFSKYQEEFIQNPNDTTAKQKFAKVTEKLESRVKTPEDIVKISKAKLLLDKPEEAIKYASRAIDAQTMNSSDTARQGIVNQATQLKNLAQIQNTDINKVSKEAFKQELHNIQVSDDLEALKKTVARKTLEKYRKRAN